MEKDFNRDVYDFIEACNKFNVRMIMVGGTAVNYYGYKRHSADVDFWIDVTEINLQSLVQALRFIGYKLPDLPEEVKSGEQNISIKISPDLEIELLTSFNPGKTFDAAYEDSVVHKIEGHEYLKWNIISLKDLISSKIGTNRPKDKLDVEVLQRILKF